MANSDLAEMGAYTQHPAPRRVLPGHLQRRRQRSPSSDARGTGSSEETMRRANRSKRRKLDLDLSPAPTSPIKYGYFGQVEPGKLKLEIISCDGGEHRDPRHPSTSLGAQNLLRHDKSVYCSESPSSGIVLRHADDSPFCLEKLHIVGPEHGFTAPVREGLVYVAMSLNDLSKYMDRPPHARVRGVHTPPYHRQRRSSDRLSLFDALRDPEVGAALNSHDRDRPGRADLANGLSDDEEFYFGRLEPDAHCDIAATTDNPDIVVTADDGSLPVALLSDEEPGPEENSSQEVLDFRLQRLRNMRRRVEMDSWDREERVAGGPYSANGNVRDRNGSWGLRHLDAMMARSRTADPQHDELADEHDRYNRDQEFSAPASTSYYHAEDYDPERAEYYDDGLNDPTVTRARFYIRHGKYKVAIKFEPPVSGRFILLKLWASRSNVDVQTVIAKGYGGSRFFPAIEFR